MAHKKIWKKIANYVEETYGVQVDYTEGFFICPECGEPIYDCDWGGGEYEFDGETAVCPVCAGVIWEKEEQ